MDARQISAVVQSGAIALRCTFAPFVADSGIFMARCNGAIGAAPFPLHLCTAILQQPLGCSCSSCSSAMAVKDEESLRRCSSCPLSAEASRAPLVSSAVR